MALVLASVLLAMTEGGALLQPIHLHHHSHPQHNSAHGPVLLIHDSPVHDSILPVLTESSDGMIDSTHELVDIKSDSVAAEPSAIYHDSDADVRVATVVDSSTTPTANEQLSSFTREEVNIWSTPVAKKVPVKFPVKETPLTSETAGLLSLEGQRKKANLGILRGWQKKKKNNPKEKPHYRRQKRHTFRTKLRSIVVPLSVFHFLGFLPMRVPGLPYHNDLPSPDYYYYNTMYDFHHYPPSHDKKKLYKRRNRRYRH